MIISHIQVVNASTDNSNCIAGTLISKDNITSSIATLSAPVTYSNITPFQFEIDSISISGNNIGVLGEINGDLVELEGSLFDSYTQKDGYDAYVANMVDKQNNYEVIYCYIQLNSQYYKYSFDEQLRDKPMFLLYLRDKNGNLIIFEKELDNLNIDTEKIQSGDFTLADSIDDYLWFFKITELIEEEVTNVVPYAIVDGYTTSPKIIRTSVIGSETYEVSAWGKINASISDNFAQTTLTFQEEVYRDDEFYSNDTPFSIVYPYGTSIEMGKVIVGNNTTIQNFHWGGEYYIGGGVDNSTTVGFSVGYFAKYIGIGLNFSAEYVKDIAFQSQESLLYREGDDAGWPRAAKITNPEDKELTLSEHGQHLDLVAGIASIGNEYTSTEAQFAWSFQIDFLAETNQYSVNDLDVIIPYSVN